MAATLLLVSFVSFIIIQAAPGDYAEIFAAKKAATGAIITQADIEAIRIELGLDRPWYVQYGRWLAGALQGDFGYQLGLEAAGWRGDRRAHAADAGHRLLDADLHVRRFDPDRHLFSRPSLFVRRPRLF